MYTRRMRLHQSSDALMMCCCSYFLYTALLPACATGTVEERSIVEPVRRVLHNKVGLMLVTPGASSPFRHQVHAPTPQLVTASHLAGLEIGRMWRCDASSTISGCTVCTHPFCRLGTCSHYATCLGKLFIIIHLVSPARRVPTETTGL